MLQPPQRSALSGPALIRLLARLADADVPASSQSLSDRLSQWVGWTDAIALSTALSVSPPAAVAGARAGGQDAESQCARVRAALANAIAGPGTGAPGARRDRAVRAGAPAAATEAVADYADFRQHYLSMQQVMQTDIGDLRGRLRRMLAIRTPGLARLAVLDATMERALAARERSLLATVPVLLGTYFERLRQAEQQRLADAGTSEHAEAVAPGAWLDAFRKDLQSVLLAELEVRFQPVEGLLAALRTR